MEHRTVATVWTGGMRAVTSAGGFEIVVDEPESSGGTDTGPQPTDLLLASVSSCFALAMAYVANRGGTEMSGLRVSAVGSYEGARFARIAVTVTADIDASVLKQLVPEAERLCYVTNTLRTQPEVTIGLG
jgi:putative redox protein